MQSNFNPRPPRGGRLNDYAELMAIASISIHAPREGGDPSRPTFTGKPCTFQSTPPARGATAVFNYDYGFQDISIHAPREGGDDARVNIPVADTVFQSTPPARGATADAVNLYIPFSVFQSTPPARGATTRSDLDSDKAGNFNPRPPRGGRPMISRSTSCSVQFQSTPPARGATRAGCQLAVAAQVISIHAPREGGDWAAARPLTWAAYFNPRPPRGGRRHAKRFLRGL